MKVAEEMAASSIEARTGYPDGEPLRLGHTLPDGTGGLVGALAVLRGLRERANTGTGGWFDISQLEVYAALCGEDLLVASVTGDALPRLGNRSRQGAIQGVYPCRGDDEWIATRLSNEEEVHLLAKVIGIDGLDGPTGRDHDALDHLISTYTRSRDKHEMTMHIQEGGLEAFAVAKPDNWPQTLIWPTGTSS